MLYILKENPTREEKERLKFFVRENSKGNLFQDPVWVKIQGHSLLKSFLYYWVEEEDKIMASALIRRHVVPGVNWSNDIIVRGPVCSDPEILKLATKDLIFKLRSKGTVSLKVNPYWENTMVDRVEKDLSEIGMQPIINSDSQHSVTLVIDLSLDKKQIFRSFRNFTRQRIRRAEQLGVQVTPVKNESEILKFCLIYKEMAKVKSINPISSEYLVRMWFELLKNEKDGIFLVAKYNGEIISGIVVLRHGCRAVYTYGTSILHKYPEVPKNQLTHWLAIQWAKEKGCSIYDLGGYLPDAREGTSKYGINQFKLGFSKNKERLVREHILTFSPVRYYIISQLESIARKVWL